MVLCGLKTVLRFAVLIDLHVHTFSILSDTSLTCGMYVDGPFVSFLFTVLIWRGFGLAGCVYSVEDEV